MAIFHCYLSSPEGSPAPAAWSSKIPDFHRPYQSLAWTDARSADDWKIPIKNGKIKMGNCGTIIELYIYI